MDPASWADVFASLLGVGLVALLIATVLPRSRTLVRRFGLIVAAAFAVGATGGSLYFSEIAGFDPCDMCWVQRIFMYPLGLLLPIAAVRRDRNLVPYAIVLAVVGLGFSLHHSRLQLFPGDSTSCDPFNPCSAKWVEALGFATIPMMAGASFVAVGVSLAMHLRHTR